ncbi:MAG: hypothetical protein QNJ97_02505 [Myxococcota bacterium]|nr:hypothetical protein [Myxococcota bacterium]
MKLITHSRTDYCAAFFAVSVCTVLLACASASAQDAIKPRTTRATVVAEQGFRDFLTRALTETTRKRFDLAPNETAKNATLGSPLRLNVIVPNKVAACRDGKCKSPDALSNPIDTYLFPVKFNGQLKLFMSVDRYKNRDDFEIGSLGYKALARELTTVFKKWPRSQNAFKLYVCDQAQTYAFSIPELGPDNLTLIDFSRGDRIKYGELSTMAQTIQILQKRISATLASGVQ